MKLNQHQKELLDYLQTMKRLRESMGKRPEGMVYLGMEDFLLQHGQWYTIPVLTLEKVRRGRMKECFNNSLNLALREGFRYVEGVATGVIPVHHAWNSRGDGLVIDSTWTEGTAYFGVEFPPELVFSKLKVGCSPLDDWKDHWELFRKPFTGYDPKELVV